MKDDRFIELVEAVEAEGGELLLKTHWPTPIVYKVPGRNGRVRRMDDETSGCGHETLFSIPYDVGEGDVVEQGFLELCAVCDMLDRTPRFG